MTKATGRFANGNSPTAMFEKALRAFEIGSLTFAELQLTLKQQLADGASPEDLVKIMQRRELIEPLPDYAYEAVLGLLQAEENARGSSDAAMAGEESLAQRATSLAAAAETDSDSDSDEPAMSRLLQALAADWDPESGKGAAAHADTSLLRVEIQNLRAALDQREEDLDAMRTEHARVLGLLEARARTAAQLEADLRAHAAELKTLQNVLQVEKDKNRRLHEALAENLAASEAAEKRGAEMAERCEEALRSAESLKAQLTALQEEAAARDDALHEAHRLLEERDSALRQARRSLDERESTLEQTRYSLSEHEAALDQARQLVSERDDVLDQTRHALIEREDELDQARRLLNERDAQLVSLQQEHASLHQEHASLRRQNASLQEEQAQLAPVLESHSEAAAKVRADLAKVHADLQAALERGAALEADLITAHEALGAEQSRSRRFDVLLAEKNSELAEKTAMLADARALESELDEAYHRIDELASELNLRAPKNAQGAVAPAMREAAEPQPGAAPSKHSVEVAEFTLPPQAKRLDPAKSKADPARRKADPASSNVGIEEFALSPPLSWLRNKAVRVLCMCALAAAVVIGIWLLTQHHEQETKVAEVPASAVPQPGTVIRDCETCPAMTVLPKGRFKQGSAEGGAASVKPMHWVAIDQPFAMSIDDLTVAQFRAFAAATGRNMQGCDVYDGQWKHQQNGSWQNPGFEQSDNHPVTCASWNDAQGYAQWLSSQTGHHYRLPSASEWEYAARAGSNAAQSWGANGADACLNANVADASAAHRYPGWTAFGCTDGYVYTSPVGSFKANAFGLHDMLGNVFQWTEDCWNPNYVHAPIDGSARSDGDCGEHEMRGGSWFSSPEYLRADYRNHFAADYRASSIGIRLVRDLTP